MAPLPGLSEPHQDVGRLNHRRSARDADRLNFVGACLAQARRVGQQHWQAANGQGNLDMVTGGARNVGYNRTV